MIEIAVISVLGTIVVALIGLVGVLTRNGRVHHNPANPDQVKIGDMSVAYWKGEFDRLHSSNDTMINKLDEMNNLLRDRLPPRGE